MQIFAKLPIELIHKVLSYSYNTQDKLLLKDIQQYHSSKIDILKIYRDFWIYNENFEPEYPNDDVEWLANDLMGYINEYVGTMYGYVDNCYAIFRRFPLLNTRLKIDAYLLKYCGYENFANMNDIQKNKQIQTEINIYWGIFTIEERTEFIRISQIAQNPV